jgi:L-ribulokinase
VSRLRRISMAVDPASALVVGVDFGTLSGRALVARVADGAELGSGRAHGGE